MDFKSLEHKFFATISSQSPPLSHWCSQLSRLIRWATRCKWSSWQPACQPPARSAWRRAALISLREQCLCKPPSQKNSTSLTSSILPCDGTSWSFLGASCRDWKCSWSRMGIHPPYRRTCSCVSCCSWLMALSTVGDLECWSRGPCGSLNMLLCCCGSHLFSPRCCRSDAKEWRKLGSWRCLW